MEDGEIYTGETEEARPLDEGYDTEEGPRGFTVEDAPQEENAADWRRPLTQEDRDRGNLTQAKHWEEYREAHRYIVEDNRRLRALKARFDPITGRGSTGERYRFRLDGLRWWLPVSMRGIPFMRELRSCGTAKEFCRRHKGMRGREELVMRNLFRLRCLHDFPFWCATCVTIKDKASGQNIKFRLNRPQRATLEVFERQRLAGVPIRVIILKARQWGGSTLTQIYMAWIQLMHKEGWHSAIVAHLSGASLKIRAMYQKMIANYPPSMLGLPPGQPLRLVPYGGSRTDVTIAQGKRTVRDNVISVGSMQSPESIRSSDVAMAHYSEVGLWKKTDQFSPEDIIQSVSGSILEAPMTVEVMESTAKGENNFFHHEWLDAKNGISNREPVFIPWYEIELYSLPFKGEMERQLFAMELHRNRESVKARDARSEPGAYLWKLWTMGATLEAIHWYTEKRRAFRTHDTMASEYPSDDIEAFAHSGRAVFDKYRVERLRDGCCSPRWLGEVAGAEPTGPRALQGVTFRSDTQGELKIWEMPDTSFTAADRYVVSTDVGGRSERSDFSDIVVLDRWWRTEGEGDVVVAEWHGHCSHEVLAWKMAQIATFYCNALLVVESNTYQSKDNDTEGDHSQFILEQIGRAYRNMYTRQASPEKIRRGRSREWGFFTSATTKELIIDNLRYVIDRRLYTEREQAALAEYNVYQRDESGKANAAKGYHDDRVMARAIGLYVSGRMPLPRETRRREPGAETCPAGESVTEAIF